MRKKTVQTIAVILLLLGIILTIPFTDWANKTSIFGFFSIVLGTLGSIISIFIPNKFEFFFKANDWVNGNMLIKNHGFGKSPNVIAYLKNDDGIFSRITIATSHDVLGNIHLGCNIPFEGKIVVS